MGRCQTQNVQLRIDKQNSGMNTNTTLLSGISINTKKKSTRGNNVNVQLNGARTRHRKVFPEERTHTWTIS